MQTLCIINMVPGYTCSQFWLSWASNAPNYPGSLTTEKKTPPQKKPQQIQSKLILILSVLWENPTFQITSSFSIGITICIQSQGLRMPGHRLLNQSKDFPIPWQHHLCHPDFGLDGVYPSFCRALWFPPLCWSVYLWAVCPKMVYPKV